MAAPPVFTTVPLGTVQAPLIQTPLDGSGRWLDVWHRFFQSVSDQIAAIQAAARALTTRVTAVETAATALTARVTTLEGVWISLAGATSYADDAAAAGGGVAVGHLYRNGSVVQIRIV